MPDAHSPTYSQTLTRPCTARRSRGHVHVDAHSPTYIQTLTRPRTARRSRAHVDPDGPAHTYCQTFTRPRTAERVTRPCPAVLPDADAPDVQLDAGAPMYIQSLTCPRTARSKILEASSPTYYNALYCVSSAHVQPDAHAPMYILISRCTKLYIPPTCIIMFPRDLYVNSYNY